MSTDTEASTTPDRIEHEIDINAGAEKVFALIDRPGWWINSGSVDPDPKVTYEDDVAVVVHPRHGIFRVRVDKREAPRYLAYRWLDRDDLMVSTLVEFRISNRDGGVTLTVIESGFTTLGNSPTQVASHIEENTEGWQLGLGAAKVYVESLP